MEVLRHINGFRPLLVIHVADLPHMRCNPVQYRTGFHRHIHIRHITDLHHTVRLSENSLAQSPADLLSVNLESCNEGNVFDSIVAELRMHEPRCEAILGGRIHAIILNALYQCTRTVADSSQCDFDLAHTFLGRLATWLNPYNKPRNATSRELSSKLRVPEDFRKKLGDWHARAYPASLDH